MVPSNWSKTLLYGAKPVVFAWNAERQAWIGSHFGTRLEVVSRRSGWDARARPPDGGGLTIQGPKRPTTQAALSALYEIRSKGFKLVEK